MSLILSIEFYLYMSQEAVEIIHVEIRRLIVPTKE